MQTGFCAVARDLLFRMRDDDERALVLFPAATFKRAARIARASLITKIFHGTKDGFCAAARDLFSRMRACRSFHRRLLSARHG